MQKFKKDFPIFRHRKDLVYLDSAATSQKPRVVIDAINNFYEYENSNSKRGIYPLAEEVTSRIEEVRGVVATYLNAKPREIVFTRNTTESLNLLAYSMSHNINKKDIVATTIVEHHSNFVPWQMLAAKSGCFFQVIDIDENFYPKFYELKKAKILALTYVSNVLGEVYDLEKIIKQIRKENPGIVIVVDAAQAVSHFPIDVKKIDCDFLVFSGHKIFAGMGVGVLYGKNDLLQDLDPFLYGGQMVHEVSIERTTFRELPDKLEAGTLNAADILSLGKGIEYISSAGILVIAQHEQELTAYLLKKLNEIEGLHILGRKDKHTRIGLVSFTVDGVHPHDIAQVLGDNGVCVRAGHHCAMPLHNRLGISSSTRVSLSIYNDKKDIDKFVAVLKKIIKKFR